jgi:hypothetical protein
VDRLNLPRQASTGTRHTATASPDENFLYVFKGVPLRGPPAADRPSGRACGLSGPVPTRTGRPPCYRRTMMVDVSGAVVRDQDRKLGSGHCGDGPLERGLLAGAASAYHWKPRQREPRVNGIRLQRSRLKEDR